LVGSWIAFVDFLEIGLGLLMSLSFSDRASACLSEVSCGCTGDCKSMGPISREGTGGIVLPNYGVTGEEIPRRFALSG